MTSMEFLSTLFMIALIVAFIKGFREGLRGEHDDILPDYLYYRDSKSGIGFGIKTNKKNIGNRSKERVDN